MRKTSKKRPGRTGHIYRRGRVWWMKFHHGGRPRYESSGSERREDAERLLARRLGEIATGKYAGPGPERITIAELVALVLADYEQHGKANLKVARWISGAHVEPMIGKIRAAEFGTRHVQKYILDRREKGAANATINRELALVRRGFNLAAEHDPPLVARVPYIARLPEDNARQGFLEDAKYTALRDALPQRLRALFVVGYHTGIRSGELRGIKWDQVDLAAGEIRLAGRQTKNRKPRTVPVYGEMAAWLDMQRTERDQRFTNCPWVFFSRDGKHLDGHLSGWAEACEAVGLAGLHFHDLRRSAVRNMERAGIPRNVAMSISGHRTEAVYRRYDIVSKRDLDQAARKLEAYLEDLRGYNRGDSGDSDKKPDVRNPLN